MIWIVWLIFIIEEVVRNYYMIKKESVIDHGLEAIIRIGVSTIIIFIVDSTSWLHVICWFLGAFFSFWLLFNIGLNALRGKPFGYVGKAALLDRLEALSPSIIFNVFAKTLLAVSFIYAYYNTELL